MLASIIYILCYDIWFYFVHRLLHTKYLYAIHKIHHKKHTPVCYDFYTIHILEIPIQSAGLLIPIFLYKLYLYQLLFAIFFINVRGLMSHDKRCLILVGDHHLIHHKLLYYNYGEHWIDYLFGTLYSGKNIIKNE